MEWRTTEMKTSWKEKTINIFVIYIPLIVLVFFVVTPIFWTLSLSFKHSSDIVSEHFTILPDPFTLENYTKSWSTGRISQYFMNSTIISISAVICVTIIVILNGFALSRFRFRGKNLFMVFMLMTQMLPRIIIISPLYLLMRDLGLVDKLASCIIVEIATAIPFQTLLMKGFMSGVPKEIDEAAEIDGCTKMQTLFTVILPVIVPGILTVFSFAFINCWNEYLLPYTFLSSGSKFPLSVGLRYMITQMSIDYGGLAAGAITAIIPPLCLFGYVQRYLVSGMSAGAIKG